MTSSLSNSSLFGLISFAGNASLGELRARSSVDDKVLARELVFMVRDGIITFTPNTYSQADDSQAFLTLKPFLKELSVNKLVNEDRFVKAVQTALNDDVAASSINVCPTSKGFRNTF